MPEESTTTSEALDNMMRYWILNLAEDNIAEPAAIDITIQLYDVMNNEPQ
jgi:hypothetical protein